MCAALLCVARCCCCLRSMILLVVMLGMPVMQQEGAWGTALQSRKNCGAGVLLPAEG